MDSDAKLRPLYLAKILYEMTDEDHYLTTAQLIQILEGKYGATVKPFNPEVQKKCIGDKKPITCRYADMIEDELPEFEKEVAAYKEQDEDVLSYALFPQVATEYFKYRDAQEKKVDVTEGNEEAYPV